MKASSDATELSCQFVPAKGRSGLLLVTDGGTKKPFVVFTADSEHANLHLSGGIATPMHGLRLTALSDNKALLQFTDGDVKAIWHAVVDSEGQFQRGTHVPPTA